MSFLKNILKKIFINEYKHGKERDSLNQAKTLNRISYIKSERASAFTSKGSITLEAALVVPIFFLATLCMVYLFEMTAIQTVVRSALHSVAREVAKETYLLPVVSAKNVEQRLVRNIGAERLNQSIVAGGASGLDCSASNVNASTAEAELIVEYDLEIPVPFFRIPTISKKESLRVKGWTGYVSGGGKTEEDTIVYITDYGVVYHQDMYCTYLELSIKAVPKEDIEELRNQSGGKYYACSSCKKHEEDSNVFYVTDYGDRYHSSLECSKVKRNIYAVPLDEVYGLGGCSKCVN